jgi:ADP-ribosylglycohydrolase
MPIARTPTESQIRCCLLGGAVGDALGTAVEFDTIAGIHAAYGPMGVTDPIPAFGVAVPITDDTQMTPFTVEGLIRAHQRATDRSRVGLPGPRMNARLRLGP